MYIIFKYTLLIMYIFLYIYINRVLYINYIALAIVPSWVEKLLIPSWLFCGVLCYARSARRGVWRWG